MTVSSVNYYEQSVQDSVSLSSSSVHRYSDDSTTTSTQAADAQQAEDSIVRPFNSEELMYLASIFEDDEHDSNEGDLSSILSLNQEGSAQDYSFDL